MLTTSLASSLARCRADDESERSVWTALRVHFCARAERKAGTRDKLAHIDSAYRQFLEQYLFAGPQPTTSTLTDGGNRAAPKRYDGATAITVAARHLV